MKYGIKKVPKKQEARAKRQEPRAKRRETRCPGAVRFLCVSAPLREKERNMSPEPRNKSQETRDKKQEIRVQLDFFAPAYRRQVSAPLRAIERLRQEVRFLPQAGTSY